MTTSAVYDGTIEGLFSAVFELYAKKLEPCGLYGGGAVQRRLDDLDLLVLTDAEKAGRIRRSIFKYTGREGSEHILYAFASGRENKDLVIYRYLTAVYEFGENTPDRLNDKRVADFFDIRNAVAYETHRFRGYIRFKESTAGFFYAYFEPDNDITAFLMPHFTERFKGMRFMLHDVRRNIVGLYNGERWRVFQNTGAVTVEFAEREEDFIKLFKLYYKSVNILSRKNLKLMNACLPRRYRKNMPETQE
jgi:probable DNA metabolism protein